MKKLLVLSLSLLIAVVSCKKNESTETPAGEAFDKVDQHALLSFWADSIIGSSYAEFELAGAELAQHSSEFAANPTNGSLLALQESWSKSALALKRMECLMVGPIAEKLLYLPLDRWPVNESAINALIASGTTIDSTFIANQGSLVKGIPALEYLIFSRKNGNAFVLEQFTTGTKQKVLKSYVTALSANIRGMGVLINTEWKAYRSTYLSKTGRGTTSSLAVSLNAVITLCENVKNKKIGKPLGAIDGVARHEEIESNYADQGTQLILANLYEIRRFTGTKDRGLNKVLNDMQI
ncbi:MAG: imelysin family protein, partial [Bacteroidota bacterium]